MMPLRVPPGTPGFDPWRGRTPQPRNWREWAKLVRRISEALREWYDERRRRKTGAR